MMKKSTPARKGPRAGPKHTRQVLWALAVDDGSVLIADREHATTQFTHAPDGKALLGQAELPLRREGPRAVSQVLLQRWTEDDPWRVVSVQPQGKEIRSAVAWEGDEATVWSADSVLGIVDICPARRAEERVAELVLAATGVAREAGARDAG